MFHSSPSQETHASQPEHTHPRLSTLWEDSPPKHYKSCILALIVAAYKNYYLLAAR